MSDMPPPSALALPPTLPEHETLLREGAATLGVELDPAMVSKLLLISARLTEWNQLYNLTAIDEPEKILTHHLLDSLSVHTELAGERIADVGTGAGFPGLPLAIANPQRQFTLIDSVAKKLRFVDHMVQELGLGNVRTLHTRVEQLKSVDTFNTVITRAFAPLPRMLQFLAPICDQHTHVIAMKGRWPAAAGMDDAAPLPSGWRIESIRKVAIPGLNAQRHLLSLRRTARLAAK